MLGCGLLGAHEARPPLYVIEWVRFGFVLPIFIKFGLYSPRVDPEYAGESRGRGGWRFPVGSPWGIPRFHSLFLGQTWCFTTLTPLPEKWGGSSAGSRVGR